MAREELIDETEKYVPLTASINLNSLFELEAKPVGTAPLEASVNVKEEATLG